MLFNAMLFSCNLKWFRWSHLVVPDYTMHKPLDVSFGWPFDSFMAIGFLKLIQFLFRWFGTESTIDIVLAVIQSIKKKSRQPMRMNAKFGNHAVEAPTEKFIEWLFYERYTFGRQCNRTRCSTHVSN